MSFSSLQDYSREEIDGHVPGKQAIISMIFASQMNWTMPSASVNLDGKVVLRSSDTEYLTCCQMLVAR